MAWHLHDHGTLVIQGSQLLLVEDGAKGVVILMVQVKMLNSQMILMWFYVGSSCSLLVLDRGNKAIREIELNYDDCNNQFGDGFNLGIVFLVAAGFFGYLLALFQRKVQRAFSSLKDTRSHMMRSAAVAPYQTLPKSVRPSLIPNEDEPEKLEEGFFGSVGKIFLNNGSSVAEIFGGLFSGFRRKPLNYQIHQQYQQINRHSNAWPLQESFVIPDDDEPPSIETKTPTAKKIYPLIDPAISSQIVATMEAGMVTIITSNYSRCSININSSRQLQYQPQQQQMQQHHHRQYSSGPTTHFEKNCETNEIVFGAVQEQHGRREAMVIKAVDYGDSIYNHQNIRSRYNYTGRNYNSY